MVPTIYFEPFTESNPFRRPRTNDRATEVNNSPELMPSLGARQKAVAWAVVGVCFLAKDQKKAQLYYILVCLVEKN